VEAVDTGCATYTFKSRVVTIFVPETRIPRLFPPPLEYTFIVEPFSELNEKLADPREPVPLHSTPVTVDVPMLDAVELLTVTTEVRNFAFAVVVPPKTMPFNV
jgi:hypothetical protein